MARLTVMLFLQEKYPSNINFCELLIIGRVNLGGTTYYYIRSGLFQSAFLRMDGSQVTQFRGAGSGTVDCQYYAVGTAPNSVNDDELFRIIPLQNYPGPW